MLELLFFQNVLKIFPLYRKGDMPQQQEHFKNLYHQTFKTNNIQT